MTKEHFSVEIFKDADSPELDLDCVNEGVEVVNAITGKLKVVRSDRKIRIAKPDAEVVRAETIRWRPGETDMRIIATHRPLKTAEDRESDNTIGFARLSKGVAVVKIVDNVDPHVTVAHELGHLHRLRYGHDNFHCSDKDCIMVRNNNTVLEKVHRQRQGMLGNLEKIGLVPPKYEVEDRRMNREFCGSCAEQLARRAFFALQYLNGNKNIPVDWF